jgi:hypothetical protein
MNRDGTFVQRPSWLQIPEVEEMILEMDRQWVHPQFCVEKLKTRYITFVSGKMVIRDHKGEVKLSAKQLIALEKKFRFRDNDGYY